MSLDTVRPYFKARMEKLGLSEWKNPFDTQNIPKTIIKSAYNITLGTLQEVKNNQLNLDLVVPVNVKMFAKAYKEHMVAYDQAVSLAQDAIIEIMKPSNRLTQVGIKTIRIGSMTIDPLSPSDDNIMVVNFVFNVSLAMDVC